MALLKGWAQKVHLAQARTCKIASTGLGFDVWMKPPTSLHVMFKRSDGLSLSIELVPQEVEELRLACAEFNERRGVGLYAKPEVK